MSKLSLSVILSLAVASPLHAEVVAHWVQLGPGGSSEVRAVDQDAGQGERCPEISVDGERHAMLPRAAASDKFPRVCGWPLPQKTANVAIAGSKVPTPVVAPRRIVVLGDTGCRIKPPALQNCNDQNTWPFAQLARAAAGLHPDLVIHVGDYLYRENACPPGNAGCAGTPWGDNWSTWAADFFSPAAPLLAAAPIVAVRGNHETCARSGAGYLRLLGPGPFDPNAPCGDHLTPYVVPAGAMNLVVFDDSSAPDTSVAGSLLPDFKADFSRLATIASAPLWLLMHRPIFGLIKGPFGIPVGGNLTMIEAAGDLRALGPVELMLAGHIHAFEAINYSAHVPPQILAGHGGDNLDVTPADLRGAKFQGRSGVSVKDGLSVGGFGFLLLTKSATGWTIDLYKADGSSEGKCLFANARVDCSNAGTQGNAKTGG